MAIQVQPRVQAPQRQQQPERDIFDKIMLGLQAANSVLGIKGQLEQSEMREFERERLTRADELAAQQRAEEKQLDPFKEAALVQQGFQFSSGDEGPQPANAIQFQTPSGEPRFGVPGLTVAQRMTVKQQEDAAVAQRIAAKEKLDTENAKNLYDIKQDFRNDKGVVKAQESFQAAEYVNTLLDQESPVLDAIALRQVFRLSGDVGVIREQDLADLGASPALKDRAELAISKLLEGKRINDTERADLKRMSENVMMMRRRDVNRVATTFAKDGAGRIKGLNQDEVMDYLNPAGILPAQSYQFVAPEEGFKGTMQSVSQDQQRPKTVADLIQEEKMRRAGMTAGSR